MSPHGRHLFSLRSRLAKVEDIVTISLIPLAIPRIDENKRLGLSWLALAKCGFSTLIQSLQVFCNTWEGGVRFSTSEREHQRVDQRRDPVLATHPIRKTTERD
jgi:hypothetical protein